MTTSDTTLIDNEVALVLGEEGPAIRSASDVSDIIGEAMGAGAVILVIPKQRLADTYFDLKSGLAGELAQKCVNYRIKLVVLGDIETEIVASNAFRDYVREANRGGEIRFVGSFDELGRS